MSVLETAKKLLTRTAKDAAKLSNEIAQQTKLKLKATEIKVNIDEKYTQLGELYYGAIEYELDNGEKIGTVVDEIKALKEDLDNIEEEISKIKNSRKDAQDSENADD